MVSEQARELEAHMRRLFSLSNDLLSLDMEDRWGGRDPETRDRIARETSDFSRRHRETKDALVATVKRLRDEGDDAPIKAWANAHIALLERVIETSDPEKDSTSIFVAREERGHWRELAAGKRDFVHRNCFYIRYDKEQYAGFFG